MRIPKLVVSSLALVLVVLPAVGRAETKVGVIDIGAAMDQIEDGKVFKTVITKEGEDRQSKLQSRKSELDKASAEYEKQASVLADSAKRDKEMELQKRVMELQQLADTMQREMDVKRDELLAPIQNRMNLVVKEVADAEGLGLIVRSEAVFYSVPSLDITNEVVRKYNTRYPRKAGGVAPASAVADPKPKPASDKPVAKPK
jgi:outer membrane protein